MSASSRVRRVASQHPRFARFAFDVLFHSLHWLAMLTVSLAWIFAGLGWLLLAAALVAKRLLPSRAYDTIADTVFQRQRFIASLERSNVRVTQHSLFDASRLLWCTATVGLQEMLSLCTVAMGLVYGAPRRPDDNDNALSATVLVLLFLSLSEMFLFGFAFHPYAAYFLSVHRSAYAATATEPRDDRNDGGSFAARRCQPTRSVYCWWFSLATFNLNHHVEHHDAPTLPWRFLPRLKQYAPELYSDPARNDAFVGVWSVVRSYWDTVSKGAEDTELVYGCADMSSSDDEGQS